MDERTLKYAMVDKLDRVARIMKVRVKWGRQARAAGGMASSPSGQTVELVVEGK